MPITNLKRLFITYILSLVIICTASGDIIVVNPGESIQMAINSASYGDTVQVAAGTYNERITLKNGVSVIGAGDDVTTIDGGASGSVVTSNGCDANTVLEGFTITNGSASHGGGMYNSNSSPTVTDCNFTGNTVTNSGAGMYNISGSDPNVTGCTFTGNIASWGGGMHNNSSNPELIDCMFTSNKASYNGGGIYNYDNSSPRVTHCTFSDNTAYSSDHGGGGMFNNSNSSPIVTDCNFTNNWAKNDGGGMMNWSNCSPTVTGCTFTDNTATNSGGGMLNYLSIPTVTNCTFTSNGSEWGAGIFNMSLSHSNVTNCTFIYNTASTNGGGMYNKNYSSPKVTNCTFSKNTSIDGGGMFNYIYCQPTVANCIFWGNSSSQIVDLDNSNSSVSFSDVQGGWTGEGGNNINSDPFFVNAITGDFRLASYGSPCMDVGDNNSIPPDTTDLDGDGDTTEPIPFDLAGELRVVNGDYEGVAVVDMGAYEYDGEYRVHNITQDAWYKTIKAAIDDSEAGDEIEVAPRTYHDSIDFEGKAITLRSSDPNDPNIVSATILNGTGYYHVVQCISGEDANTILKGFTITGGNANGAGIDQYGGGMYCENSSPMVTNCTFISNRAGWGGGMHNNNSSPMVTNCNFTSNKATNNGGGMFNHINSQPTVTYCSFSRNTASVNGGGIHNRDSNSLVADCTFLVNSSDNGGGMYNYRSTPTVTDCMFSGNSAGNHGGGMLNNLGSSPTVTKCLFSSNSAANYGAGMFNQVGSSPIVTNCSFSDNTASDYGGGMYNYYNSNPMVTNCNFTGNKAADDSGGGMMNHTSSSPSVTNCFFTGNKAEWGGGMFNRINSSPTVTNCVFSNNNAKDNCGGMYNKESSSPTVTNCTFRGNTATNYSGGMFNYMNSHPTVANCIFWGNSPCQIDDLDNSSSFVTYSDVQGGWGGTGNIDADPLFVDAANYDLRLRACSPCVDAGNNNAVPVDVNTDLAGDPRFVDDANVVDTGSGMPPIVDMGAYERQIDSFTIYNITRGTKYCRIQNAINDTNDGDQIEVPPGTYYESIDFKSKAIHLYSIGGPEVTTIDGTGAYHVVQCISYEDANTILEGFTITGGNANGTGEPNDRGGGMYCENSSPTVSECIFTGNFAEYGGGMSNWDASPTVINCFFVGNTANLEGGAILNEENSGPNIINCAFSGNDANNGGGMYNIDSSPKVTNCILWGDTPDEVNDVNSITTVTYSDIQGGWPGEGNIDKNPLLRNVIKGDPSLAPWSPCIDSGNSAVVSPDLIDITGLDRLVDGDCNGIITVDMGAAEFRHAYGGDFDSSCLVNMADFAFLTWSWLSSPQSDNWNPVCDISIPADGRIDNNDVKILTGNWLSSIDTPVTCDVNRLKDEFGLDALCAAAVLSAAPCWYSHEEVAQTLYEAGYNAADAYRALTQVFGMTDVFSVEQILFDVGYPQEEYLEVTAIERIRKFAPVLYFDQSYKGLPMSAQVYFETMMSPSPDDPEPSKITWTTPWDGPCMEPGVISVCGRDECNCGMQNKEFSTLINGQIPTYYKVISDIDSEVDTGPRGRLRIEYWWFYGFQSPCNTGCPGFGVYCGADGAHHGDWEHIIVTTDPNRTRADAVTYSFHGHWYTRLSGGFETEPNDDPQGRPVVYVGKLSHGNWHSDEMSCLWEGEAYHCCTYADCRTPDANTIWRTAYQNLVSLRGNSEPWMLADRIGSLYEYYGQEYTISDWLWGPHISYCNIQTIFGCADWEHRYASDGDTTIRALDWTIASCYKEGCGTSVCEGFIDRDYPSGAFYNQGWPWEGESMSYAAQSATPASYGSVASCGRCGASQFSALVRLGEYWLVTP